MSRTTADGTAPRLRRGRGRASGWLCALALTGTAHAAVRGDTGWPTTGGNASGAYYSKLAQINDHNVGRVGFAWAHTLDTNRGLEATPVVVGRTLYTTGNWGKVYALDAATGRELWTYDPDVDGQWGRYACCDVVNRGVAVAHGIVYVASLDGYLHALDAATGRRLWKVDTLPGRGRGAFHYFVTGAPLIAGDLVVIGNGGADFRGARGSISAYDRRTGRFRWRFYTVPRNPAQGAQDQRHLLAAVATWNRDYDWSNGGGGTVWDGLSYDAELGLIYLGTANPAPYRITNDTPHGDELYAASIVAVHAGTGTLAWYYQEVPGDGWDFDATQKMILTRLRVGGTKRPVLIQAAKNGFLYVLDRRDGRLLSAKPFTYVNWTKGIDLKTGRPLRNPDADYSTKPRLVFPGMAGAHSWQPMSFDPATGLVYIPVIDAPMVYIGTARRRAGLIEGSFEVAGVFADDYDPTGMAGLFGALPPLSRLEAGAGHRAVHRGVLRAVDPLSGRTVWHRSGSDIWDGGVLSTAGNLVVRGDVAGYLNFYAADTGTLLKRIEVGTSIIAAPATYRVDGRQYVTVMAGYGGGTLAMPFPKDSAARRFGNAGRILSFTLDGGAVPVPKPVVKAPFPQPPPREGDAQRIAAGEVLYNRYCSRCHVFGRGVLPDLRRSLAATAPIFDKIVLGGAYRSMGMARWDDVLSRRDVAAIHAYLVDQAWQDYRAR